MTDNDFGFRPDDAIANQKKRQELEQAALEQLVSEIHNDPDATATEKRLASALIALKES